MRADADAARAEVARAADEARAAARRDAEERERSAALIQAARRGKQERAEAARRAAAARPARAWRFAHESTRAFDTAGHNAATFFVADHERISLAEVRSPATSR